MHIFSQKIQTSNMIVATVLMLVLTLVCTPLCLTLSFCLDVENTVANFFVKFWGIKILQEQARLAGSNVEFLGTVEQTVAIEFPQNSNGIANAFVLQEATLCVCSNATKGFVALIGGEIVALVSALCLCKLTNAKVQVSSTCSTKSTFIIGDVLAQCTLLSIFATLVKKGVASWKARKSTKL